MRAPRRRHAGAPSAEPAPPAAVKVVVMVLAAADCGLGWPVWPDAWPDIGQRF
jgi:hypothetical protein